VTGCGARAPPTLYYWQSPELPLPMQTFDGAGAHATFEQSVAHWAVLNAAIAEFRLSISDVSVLNEIVIAQHNPGVSPLQRCDGICCGSHTATAVAAELTAASRIAHCA